MQSSQRENQKVPELTIRGRAIADSDVDFIRRLVESHKGKNRYELSNLLAEAWQWRQANGRPKDRACRTILSVLDQKGLITLPRIRRTRRIGKRPLDQTEILFDRESGRPGHLRDVLPLQYKMVCQTAEESLWNTLLRQYHYLGYTNLVGAHLKYLVYSRDGTLLAALGWSSGVWKLQPRDKAIGWTVEQRKQNLHKIVNNARFLILPWIKIPNLASTILSGNIRLLSNDWYQRYNYRPSLLETFVDAGRFSGASYKAANWIHVGSTKGYEKQGNRFACHGNVKEVYLYPLTKQFRKELGLFSDDLPLLSPKY